METKVAKLTFKEKFENFKKASIKDKLYIIFIKYQLLFVLLIALDQITKAIAVKYLQTPIILIDFGSWDLRLEYTPNTGVAFSLLKNAPQWLSAVFSVIATLAIEYYLVFKKTDDRPFAIMLLILAAGALGNGIDRWLSVFASVTGYEGVIDFIYPTFFANFNVADMYVTLTCLALVLYFIFSKDDDEISYKQMKEAKKKLKEQAAEEEKAEEVVENEEVKEEIVDKTPADENPVEEEKKEETNE